MKKKYQILLFDLDNTLFDFEASEKRALEETKHHFEISMALEDFIQNYHEVNKPLWEALERGEITSEAIRTLRFEHLIKRIGLPIDALEMSHFYVSKISRGIDTFPHAREVLETLAAKYRLVALTNGIVDIQTGRLMHSGLGSYFSAVVISEEIGVSKPHVEIFEAALNRIGHKDKDSVLMIGDSIKADILGALSAGLDACWVNLKGQSKPELPAHVFEINTLDQLLEVL